MSQPKPDFDRLMLKNMKVKNYLRKMERIIIDEGKRILRSINKHAIIVRNDQISKFLDKYPHFKKTIWRQIGIYELLRLNLITPKQYQLLIMMKQILNKTDYYLLRPDQFVHRVKVLHCQRYNKVGNELCYMDDCPMFLVCPIHYMNDNAYMSKRLCKGTETERMHLLHCKGNHKWVTPFSPVDVDYEQRELLVCKKINEFVDKNALSEEIMRLVERK